MPAFKRLTRGDLEMLTRAELLDRLEVESAYWDRKVRRGLSSEDAAAHDEFGHIMRAAIDPGDAITSARRLLDGRGDDGYWETKPGRAAGT
ncbi:hypothetical protein ACPCBF_25370 [Streptomyces pseudogriseolus]|uniref:hypothetical protein n=1 Tax=Streptomyces pseudogriseolus TaxID=36817 RepID=UPI003FA1DAA9